MNFRLLDDSEDSWRCPRCGKSYRSHAFLIHNGTITSLEPFVIERNPDPAPLMVCNLKEPE